MRLGCCLVASDLNRDYLDFYPLVRRVWREVVGVPAKLALIADTLPPDLAEHAGDILLVPPVPGVHTAFQAQCVRLLLPALMEAEAGGGAVLTSDIDMLPMNRPYYVDGIAGLPDDAFAVLRANVLMADAHEVAICYNAARPATWNEAVGGVSTLDDVRRTLADWGAARADYDGRHDGVGWNTDQRILYEILALWTANGCGGRVAHLTDDDTGYRRLDRLDIELNGGLTEREAEDARAGRFTDYHMMRPPARYRGFNAEVGGLPPRTASS